MAETKLDIKVDHREVSGLEKLLKRIFHRDTAKGFNSAIGETNRLLERQRRHMESIVRELNKVDRGTEKWKRLNQQLRESNQEMRQLESTMQRLGGGAGPGAGAAGKGGGGGLAGRMAGAQIPHPSMGGLATALGGIPVAGAIAAGALMTTAQAYGSYRQYAQARQQAAPFLMPSGGQAYFQGPGGGGGGNPFARANRAGVFDLVGDLGSELVSGLGGGPIDTKKVVRQQEELLQRSMEILGSVNPLTGVVMRGVDAARRGLMAQMGLDVPEASGAGGRRTGRSADFTFDARAYNQAGRMFGLTPQQAIQQAGALSQAAGRPVGPGEFGAGLALQQLFGVGTQQQGGFMMASRWAGNQGSMQEVANMIGIAVSSELEGSEIGMWLGEQTQWLKAMYSQGYNVSLGGVQAGAAGLMLGGVTDVFRAFGYTRDFTGGAARVGRQGPRSGADLRLMRAMGFTGEGGFEEYAKFRMQMQDPGEVARAMPAYLKSFGLGPGAGQFTQGLIIQQAMGAFGGNMNAQDAIALGANLAGLQTGSFGQTNLQQMLAAGSGLARATNAVGIGAAGIEAQRIGEGARAAAAVQALERASLNLANIFNNTLGQSVYDFALAIDDATGWVAQSIQTATRKP